MSFGPGQTPFGFFDQDPAFAADADKLVDFTRKKLGDPVLSVHLSSSQVYAAFEEACLEYSALVNQYQAKSVLASFLGAQTGSFSGSEQKFVSMNLELQRKLSEPYNDSGPNMVDSSLPLYSGSLQLVTGQQKYDLNAALTGVLAGISGSSGQKPRIRDLFYFSPLSAFRFFGTTSALNYLNGQFNFESFTPETIFYLLPIWEDVLRGMQFKTSNKVRRSNYSYEIHNNELTIYPVPASDMPLFFTFTLPPNPVTAPQNSILGSDPSYWGVSNLSNIPFGNITYGATNSISRNWIRKMAFALAKEVEGQIRAKMQSIPIPNGDLNLNGAEMINDARAEQDRLREEMKAILDATTYDKLAAQAAEQAEAVNRVNMLIPLGIYIG